MSVEKIIGHISAFNTAAVLEDSQVARRAAHQAIFLIRKLNDNSLRKTYFEKVFKIASGYDDPSMGEVVAVCNSYLKSL